MRVCAEQTFFFFFLISQGKGGEFVLDCHLPALLLWSATTDFLFGTGLGLHVTSCDAHHDFVTSRWRAMISWGSLSCLAVRSLL